MGRGRWHWEEAPAGSAVIYTCMEITPVCDLQGDLHLYGNLCHSKEAQVSMFET